MVPGDGSGRPCPPQDVDLNSIVDRETPMPNVTWQEPQVFIELLAINLFGAGNHLTIAGPRELAIVSPWLSDVEIGLRPGPWYQQFTVGVDVGTLTLSECLKTFRRLDWLVEVAVLAYGASPSGLNKNPSDYPGELRLLDTLLAEGVLIYLVPDLHAKGIVTPLGVITGSTNVTHSGLYAQAQNANYFAHDHQDYAANRIQLLNRFRGVVPPASTLPSLSL